MECYKRRSSNHNFLIFNLYSRQSDCFLWSESISGRGANEISSCLLKYISDADVRVVEVIDFFCDATACQNKNSTFLRKASSVKRMTIFYFETNHGQSAGDSVRSVIERALGRVTNLYVPSQLPTLIRLACNRSPYNTTDLSPNDMMDYCQLSKDLGILRAREAHDGSTLMWPSIKQVRVESDELTEFQFKPCS